MENIRLTLVSYRSVHFIVVLVLSMLSCTTLIVHAEDRPMVNIPGLGSVMGTSDWKSTWSKRPILSFRGIPFGKPPIGPLRYKPSLPAEPWKGVHDGEPFGRICVQTGSFLREGQNPGFWDYVYGFSKNIPKELLPSARLTNKEDDNPEDCLNLQIYTPTTDMNANLPVMVFYHGGAFLDGSSLIYWPQNLLEHDVVLVVPHYRLGPIGFISMQNDDIPGNAGLFDQILALEWVRDHIKYFGGNPNDVTAFGESAGAASVSLLCLNSRAKGLFNRIIAQSGSSITEWAIDRYPVYNALGIAGYAGCDTTKPEAEIVKCLMEVDPYVLTEAYKYHWKSDEMKAGRTGFGGSSPVVQTNKGTEIFIDRMPIEIWNDQNFTTVPAMYGANKHEGTYVMAIVYDGYLRANDLLDDEEFIKYDSISVFLNLFEVRDPSYVIHDALEYEYIGIDRMGNLTAMTPGMIDFSGATFLKASSFQNMLLHLPFGNCFWYAFNFLDRATLWPFIGGGSDVPFPGGVTHSNELIFIFNIPGISDTLTKAEQNKSEELTKIWYNYAAYGLTQPEGNKVERVPDWPPYDRDSDGYVRFDFTNLNLTYFPSEYTIAKDENFAL